jgi:hypothetical protein
VTGVPSFAFGETVVLVTRALDGVDGDGNDVYTSTEVTLSNVPVWPGFSTEATSDRDTVITGYSAFLPPETDVSAVDQVRVFGVSFDVVGEPARYRSPLTGLAPGVVVQLKRVEG